jgi:hypothetical protein
MPIPSPKEKKIVRSGTRRAVAHSNDPSNPRWREMDLEYRLMTVRFAASCGPREDATLQQESFALLIFP